MSLFPQVLDETRREFAITICFDNNSDEYP